MKNRDTGHFAQGSSGNPGGRAKGQHSPENEMKRAKDAALRNVARQAEQGDLQASIAVLQYMKEMG